MEMVMYLRRASRAAIERVRNNPEELETFIFPDEAEDLTEVSVIDFDKAWQALHFTLSGNVYGPIRQLGIIAG